MTIPTTSFSGLKWYSPPSAFLDFLNLRFFSFASWVVMGLGVDAEESVVSVESDESKRCDCCLFTGKNFASPPTGFEGRVGGLFLSPISVAGVVGVRPSTGAKRSSSSESSSSEERPSSWKSVAHAPERIVPIPSVYIEMMNEEGKKEDLDQGLTGGAETMDGLDRFSIST